jgi:ABC-2 type transport system permease protein
MRKTYRLLVGILWKRLLLLYRYRVNTGAYLISLYAFFLLIFFGGQAVAGGAFDDSLDSVVVGYFLVAMSFTAYNELAQTFSKEASWGTLEQLFMSRSGFGHLTLVIAVVQVLVGFGFGMAVLLLMLLTTGVSIDVDLVSVVPIAMLAVSSVVGLGFVFGGAAIVYKRVGNVLNIVQFGFFGLVAAPVDKYPLLKFLPLAQGSHLLQRVMGSNLRLWEIAPEELAILVGTGVGYALVGYVVMLWLVGLARRRGVMGHY